MNSFINLTFIGIQLFVFTQITNAAVFQDKRSAALVKSCGGKPADIVFALDASSSIWGPDFEKQLKFVQDLIGIFTINKDAVRVGMMTFSDEPHDQFHLGEFDREKYVHEAVGRTYQRYGGTKTHLALQALHKRYFNRRYSREGVVHIGIIITDGKSEDTKMTAMQAEYARRSGIYLFAVGVGQQADQTELRKIANSPSDQYVLMVENYSALDSIKELLAMQTCRVTEPPRTTTLPPTTTTTLPPTTTPPPADQGCGASVPADVIFALPPKISAEDGASALRFLREMSYDFDIESEEVRMALVPQECQALSGFPFGAAKNHDELDDLLIPPSVKRSNTAGVLRFMRRAVKHNKRQLRSLDNANDGRKMVKNIGVIIVDCNSPHLSRTALEALRAKRQAEMELFVITVGKNVNPDEAEIIASDPSSSHVFSVTDYEDLHSIRERLVESINSSCDGEWKRRRMAFQ